MACYSVSLTRWKLQSVMTAKKWIHFKMAFYHVLDATVYLLLGENYSQRWLRKSEYILKWHFITYLMKCNKLNQGHSTFFCQSQQEFRTKESEFIHFGPITNENQIWLGIEGIPVLLFCTRLVIERKTLGGTTFIIPGSWARYTVISWLYAWRRLTLSLANI